MHVNACITVKPFAGFLQCNGGTFDESEDYNYLFFCVFSSFLYVGCFKNILVSTNLSTEYQVTVQSEIRIIFKLCFVGT